MLFMVLYLHESNYHYLKKKPTWPIGTWTRSRREWGRRSGCSASSCPPSGAPSSQVRHGQKPTEIVNLKKALLLWISSMVYTKYILTLKIYQNWWKNRIILNVSTIHLLFIEISMVHNITYVCNHISLVSSNRSYYSAFMKGWELTLILLSMIPLMALASGFMTKAQVLYAKKSLNLT